MTDKNNIDIKRLADLCRLCEEDFSSEAARARLAQGADYTYALLNCDRESLPFSFTHIENAPVEMREDTPCVSECTPDEILACAPELEGSEIKVPTVISEVEP